MVINGKSLLKAAPIKSMLKEKVKHNGVSHGLSEAGYDIRLKQDVTLTKFDKFQLVSAIEEFDMPSYLVGIVHDKSSWARQGLSVFNTVIEPGWKGFLTLELVYHANKALFIPKGTGIAQVIFHGLHENMQYDGKYQNQADMPVKSIESK